MKPTTTVKGTLAAFAIICDAMPGRVKCPITGRVRTLSQIHKAAERSAKRLLRAFGNKKNERRRN